MAVDPAGGDGTLSFMSVDALLRENEILREELAARDRCLAERDRCLAERDRCLAERDRRLAELEHELAALTKKLELTAKERALLEAKLHELQALRRRVALLVSCPRNRYQSLCES